MKTPRGVLFFCLVTAALGLPLLVLATAFGCVWLALWLGLAAFYASAAQRFPRFAGEPPPASLIDLRIHDDELEGPRSAPGWVAVLAAAACATTGLAPLLAPSQYHAAGHGIPVALTLVACAVWQRRRQQASTALAKMLVRPSAQTRRFAGTIRSPELALRRQIFWFQLTGMSMGTAMVEGIHGGIHNVQTATPTANTYGFGQEVRRDFVVDTGSGHVTVTGEGLRWAAPQRPLGAAPPLEIGKPRCEADEVRSTVLPSLVGGGSAWDEEIANVGSNVVVAGTFDLARERVFSQPGQPAVAYVSDAGSDPLALVTRALGVRIAYAAVMATGAAAAVVISVLG
ncbi:MAG: hypothetical protein AAF721_12785 [Myxococcota bacterium]